MYLVIVNKFYHLLYTNIIDYIITYVKKNCPTYIYEIVGPLKRDERRVSNRLTLIKFCFMEIWEVQN